MFEMLRKMIMPIIIIVLLFFVAMIVLEWGMGFSGRGGGLDNRGNLAGVINGEEIPYQDYYLTLNNLMDQERQTRGADYEIPEDRERQLEQQAWNELVADRIIKQEGKKLNVVVTDGDVYQYLKFNPPAFLQQSPELQTNGQFDYQKYLQLMTDNQAAGFWAGIEPMVREDLKRIKVQQQVVEAVHVGEQEARQAFLDNFEKITVGMVNISTSKYFAAVSDPSPMALQTYFDEHRDTYKLGERVTLEVVRVGKTPSQADENASGVRAREIYDSVLAGADFAEFARVYSDDAGTAANGGDLGWLNVGSIGQQFDSVVATMREGEVSTPVKTTNGWHILNHQGNREENGQRQVHLAHILVWTEASSQTLDAAWQQLDMVRTQAEEVGFAEAAKAEGLEVHTTVPPVEKEGRVGYVNAGPQDIEWAFKAQVGDMSEVLDLSGYYCVMRVADKIPAGPAQLSDVEARVKRDFRNDQLAQWCLDTAKAVFAETTRGTTLADAAARHGLTYERPAAFSRASQLPQVGSDPAAMGAAFALTRIGEIAQPVAHGNGAVVFELLERQAPDLTTFEQKRDSVFEAVTRAKQQLAYNAWYKGISEAAQVESYVNFQRRR